MQIIGKLIEVMETQQVSEKFSKREFIVEYATNPEYPEQIKFQLNNATLECITDPTSLVKFYAKAFMVASMLVHGSVVAASLGCCLTNIGIDTRSSIISYMGDFNCGLNRAHLTQPKPVDIKDLKSSDKEKFIE